MIEKIKFIFIESFKTFKRYPLYSFISSLTIMICLLFISLIIYLSNVTNNISKNFESNESVLQIFINSSIDKTESNNITLSKQATTAQNNIEFNFKIINTQILEKGKIDSNLDKIILNKPNTNIKINMLVCCRA